MANKYERGIYEGFTMFVKESRAMPKFTNLKLRFSQIDKKRLGDIATGAGIPVFGVGGYYAGKSKYTEKSPVAAAALTGAAGGLPGAIGYTIGHSRRQKRRR
jgi:hypothetical protein